MFPVKIETERLLIREMEEADWLSVHEYASLPESVQYMVMNVNTPERTKQFVTHAIRTQRDSPRTVFEFAIILKETQKLIGACGIRNKDVEHREGDLGYMIRPDQWGKGLATEAARALVKFGFEQLGLHRIWATCHADNLASARVLEKSGMKREGILRKNKFKHGQWRDSALYAILEDEFK